MPTELVQFLGFLHSYQISYLRVPAGLYQGSLHYKECANFLYFLEKDILGFVLKALLYERFHKLP